MIDFLRNQIKDKSVLLLGFGREGKSSLRMILKAGGYAKIGIADQAALTPEDVRAAGVFPVEYIALHTGPDYQDAMDAYDIVFKSPGIVLKRDISEYTCRIVSQTELFFARYHDQIVGITGTKGKSTTAALLHHILQSAGRPCMLAGNIGIPVFDHCEEITPDMTIVVELSCHQLEYMTVSSAIGVLINIYEEHLDHYGTMEKYTAAKQQIYRNQLPEDVLFCNVDFLPEPGAAKSRIVTVGLEKDADISVYGSEVRVKGETYKIPTDEISLLGHHNYFDIAIDYGICRILGLSPEEFTSGLKTYETLPHRLKLIAVKDGVKYYDDSISTIDQTAIEALHTLPDADTILIGGMDRGIDYGALIEYLKISTVRSIILMEATGRRIYREIMDLSFFPHPERLHLVEHLEDAVALAKKQTRPGHSCILSPAAASYGIFKNFEERGDKFAELVRR
ncbi:MAG: UDP-N-acetylmuramoyl-L-alanine--D-glutamate ligase [Lachnospiraceae bacterium]|nr:UDP-N-acetylmuramoyl-L-alanine--D-glutamate ligase [Lachnospiraceae bacterium]